MATNMHKKYTESLTEQWEVAGTVRSGDLVIDPNSPSRPGVAITSPGVATRTVTRGKYTITGPAGGRGNKPHGATIAVDGAWRFVVQGVTNGETVEGTGTDRGTPVFRTDAGVLTLTETDNTRIGIVADGAINAGLTPIWIGR